MEAFVNEYRFKVVSGFFVKQNGKMKSPAFTITSNVKQDVYVVINHLKTEDRGNPDVGARLILMCRSFGHKRAKIFGFTSDKNEKLDYFYQGDLPRGEIHLVPVEGHLGVGSTRAGCPYEDYVNLFEEVDGSLRYSPRAEKALDYLFAMLDADNNGYLSGSEVAVLKKFLGFEHRIKEEEWTDALFGWQEGDLDDSLHQMSNEFFKKFILRLSQGEFRFGKPNEQWNILQKTPWKLNKAERRQRYLERIFELTGFDKDLNPSNSSRYSIQIFAKRNSIPEICISGQEKVHVDNAIRHLTKQFGIKRKNAASELGLYTLQCSDWFSATVKNYSGSPKEIMMDFSSSVGILTVNAGLDGLIWKETVSVDGEMSTLRFSAPRRGNGGFQIKFDVLYETGEGIVERISLVGHSPGGYLKN